MSGEVRYVRLRDYDPRSGHVTQTYSHKYAGQFVKFTEAGVWHKVPVGLADELELARQVPTNPKSPPVFDVCTEDEARRADREAKRVREEKKAKVEPTVDSAKVVEVESPDGVAGVGRGDLSLDEVMTSRLAALGRVSAQASGEAAKKESAPTPVEVPSVPKESPKMVEPKPAPRVSLKPASRRKVKTKTKAKAKAAAAKKTSPRKRTSQ